MEKKRKKRSARRLLVPVLFLLCCAVLLTSRYLLSVSRYTLWEDDLPAAFDGYRIVQLSDLHGSEFGEGNKGLIGKVAGEEPDLIVLTGDFLDEGKTEEELSELKVLMEGLTELAPVYFVSGNHDWASRSMEELTEVLKSSGVCYLRNEFELRERGDAAIVLAGVEDPNAWAEMLRPDELVELARAAYPETFTILLGHRNDWVEKYPALDVDVIFCGHGHGGIVRLPFFGGLFGTDRDWFPEYDAGLFESGRYTMVVSAGLGNSIFVPRVFNRPEIVSVTLRKA